MSCLLTQQMSWLLAQQMSCLQTQQMSCLQTHPLRKDPPPFGYGSYRMVFGHTLQHMAPFGIPTTGFCMVFQHATLIFSTTGPILGPQDLDLGSGWAGDLFGPKIGPEKAWFRGGNGPPWGFRGIRARGMDCMVPRRPLGKPISPQTLPETHFTGIFPFPGKMPGPPWALVGPLLAL